MNQRTAETVYTHKGWLGLCPIKIAEPDSQAPYVDARWWWLGWWMAFNEGFQGVFIMLLTAINPDYEPMWAIRITGELK